MLANLLNRIFLPLFLFSSFDDSLEGPNERHNSSNEVISANRRDSSSLPNKYNQNHQNSRITRGTITDDLYHYTWEPTKKVWIIGTESTTDGNAVLSGYANCPKRIEIAREKTHTDGKSYPVEIIGRYAFSSCALYESYPTRTIFVTKQVKLIEKRGFCNEKYLTSFIIESESQLQSIEYCGLHNTGYNVTRNNSLTKTLVLPSTLSSVASNGIVFCNLFAEIIYCGSYDHSINRSFDLYSSSVAPTIVRVTSNYNFTTLFGNPITDSTGDEAVKVSSVCQRSTLPSSLLPNIKSLCSAFDPSFSLLFFFVSALLTSSSPPFAFSFFCVKW